VRALFRPEDDQLRLLVSRSFLGATDPNGLRRIASGLVSHLLEPLFDLKQAQPAIARA
jgi:hypothetical protein